MIIMLILIAASVLPFLWEHIFRLTLADSVRPTKGQLVLVSFSPIFLTLVVLLSFGTGWAPDPVIMGIVSFIFLLSTLTWGYAMYNRSVTPAWMWLLQSFLTFCLYLALLFVIIFGSSSAWNINF